MGQVLKRGMAKLGAYPEITHLILFGRTNVRDRDNDPAAERTETLLQQAEGFRSRRTGIRAKATLANPQLFLPKLLKCRRRRPVRDNRTEG